MGFTDDVGYNFEMVTLDKLTVEGLGHYITYHNPRDKLLWKRTREKGIDLQFKIGGYSLDIELSYMSYDYAYRQQWFVDSRIPRFRNSQNSNEYHLNIIVTNRPQNYDSVRYLAQQSCGGIYIITIEQLIELLNSIILRYTSIIDNTVSNNNHIINDITITNDNLSINNITYNQITCMHQNNPLDIKFKHIPIVKGSNNYG